MIACDRVFSIPELRELILDSCEPQQLYQLQSVNRSWQGTITTSIFIQRLLFKHSVVGQLRDDDNTAWRRAWGFEAEAEDELRRLNDRNGRQPPWFCPHPLLRAIPIYEDMPEDGGPIMTELRTYSRPSADLSVRLEGPVFAHLNPFATRPAARSPATASWRNELIAQPAVTEMFVRLLVVRNTGRARSEAILSQRPFNGFVYLENIVDPAGITLGTVASAVEDFVSKNPCPDDAGDRYEGLGLVLHYG